MAFLTNAGPQAVPCQAQQPGKDSPKRETLCEGLHQDTGLLRGLPGLPVGGWLETPAEGSSSLVCVAQAGVGFRTCECATGLHAPKGPGLV